MPRAPTYGHALGKPLGRPLFQRHDELARRFRRIINGGQSLRGQPRPNAGDGTDRSSYQRHEHSARPDAAMHTAHHYILGALTIGSACLCRVPIAVAMCTSPGMTGTARPMLTNLMRADLGDDAGFCFLDARRREPTHCGMVPRDRTGNVHLSRPSDPAHTFFLQSPLGDPPRQARRRYRQYRSAFKNIWHRAGVRVSNTSSPIPSGSCSTRRTRPCSAFPASGR